MFFEDDDGDFSPPTAGSSKLSSLFGMASSAGSNESLTYTAPKQPKAKENGAGANAKADGKAAAHSVLNAVAVHAFKYTNGQYAKQGKLGMAILGDHKNNDYKILLYISQKQPVAAAKVHNSFNLTMQKNNYATFYDDQSQLWSICFESSSQATEFGKWVCLAKFNCSPVGLMTQDLLVGDGQALQKGDIAELQYTGHLYTNKTFGKVFESNKDSGKLYKLKLGKGKVIKGWEEGIPGMKKGGRRVVIIPPGLAYGAKGVGDRIPPNSTLIFEVDVTRAKFAVPDPTLSEESSRTASPEAASQPSAVSDTKKEHPTTTEVKETPATPTLDKSRSESIRSNKGEEKKDALSESGSESVKGRTHSITEQLSKSLEKPSGKANLLARMSKMGQSLIPGSPVKADTQDPLETTSINEDTHDQEDDRPTVEDAEPEPELQRKPVLKPRPESINHSGTPPPRQQPGYSAVNQPAMAQQASHPSQAQQQIAQPLAIYQPPQQMFGMNAMPNVAYVNPMQAMQPPQPSSTHTSTEISLLLTEGKLHHGEMKSVVERVAEKVDSLINKVERMERNDRIQGSNLPMVKGGIEMEASVLSSNINRILHENEKLKRENVEKTAKIENLNEKISDMLFKNQSFLEKSNQLMEERADSIKSNATQAQAKVISLEQENASLSTQVMSLKTQLGNLESDLTESNSKGNELKSKLHKIKEERDSARERLDSASSNVSDHKEEIEQMKSKYKGEKQENKKLKSKMENFEEELLEMRQEKESVEKALADRKRKQQSDRKKFDEEVEEIKNSHEEEIRSLKQRYKKGSLENEKLAALEAELEAKHRENLKKTLKDAESRWEEKLEEVIIERNKFRDESSLLTQKVQGLKEIEEQKEDLTRNISTMQEDYKNTVANLNEKLEDQKRKAHEFMQSLDEKENEAFVRGVEQGKKDVRTTSSETEDATKTSLNVGDEVKKIMNNVFFELKNKFEPDESYEGRDVIKEILQTIRNVTVKMTETATREEGDDEDDDEDEDEDEDDDEDEEDDEDEKEDEEDDGESEEELSSAEESDSASEVSEKADNVIEVENKSKKSERSESEDDSEDEHSGLKEVANDKNIIESDGGDGSESENDDESQNEARDEIEEVSGNGKRKESENEDNNSEHEDVDSEHEAVDSKHEADGSEYEADGSELRAENVVDNEEKISNEMEHENDTENNKGVIGNVPDNVVDVTYDTNEVDETENYAVNNTSESVTESEVTNSEVSESASLVTEHDSKSSDKNEDSGINTDFENSELKNNVAAVDPDSQSIATENVKDDLEIMDSTDSVAVIESGSDNPDASVGLDKQNTVEKSEQTAESEKPKSNKNKEASSSKGIFNLSDEDEDDDGIFSQSPAKKSAAAFNRKPPPLFDDDDEDTNWI